MMDTLGRTTVGCFFTVLWMYITYSEATMAMTIRKGSSTNMRGCFLYDALFRLDYSPGLTPWKI